LHDWLFCGIIVFMNRRNFLETVAAVPFISAVIPKSILKKDVIVEEEKSIFNPSVLSIDVSDKSSILTPPEIINAGFKYVKTLTFEENGKSYFVKTVGIPLRLPVTPPGTPIPENVKERVIREIRKIGFTHIYDVRLIEVGIYEKDSLIVNHRSYVSGATIKNDA